MIVHGETLWFGVDKVVIIQQCNKIDWYKEDYNGGWDYLILLAIFSPWFNKTRGVSGWDRNG